jgi:nitroimidazol reductase NimA-like FMN-containing flavoprotein (pyridoxamine 5'-phosphate oxidase superfamily)
MLRAAARPAWISMLILELNSEACAGFLSRAHVGRLACALFDQPYIVPIHFSFDAERRCLYAFSTVGQKIEWMRKNPRVCVEADEIDDQNQWTSVLVFGRYYEIGRGPKDADARERAEQLFQQRQDWWLPAAAKVPSRDHQEMVVYRIEIDRLSGRRTVRPRG